MPGITNQFSLFPRSFFLIIDQHHCHNKNVLWMFPFTLSAQQETLDSFFFAKTCFHFLPNYSSWSCNFTFSSLWKSLNEISTKLKQVSSLQNALHNFQVPRRKQWHKPCVLFKWIIQSVKLTVFAITAPQCCKKVAHKSRNLDLQ